jgi:DNA repair protein RadA/Sms
MREVSDPSRVLLDLDAGRGAGAVVVPTIEGTRPLLLEVQALVNPTAFGMAQRVATGLDPRRLSVLLAVLQKHGGVDASTSDVFVNVVSGIRITEPAADLALLVAVVSSMLDRPLPKGLAVLGEVGLGGELRPVGQCERRVAEAVRVGFDRVLIPNAAAKDITVRLSPHVTAARTVAEALGFAGLEPPPRRRAP